MPAEDSLVLVFSPKQKQPVGAGLLVDTNLVLTCAHVVNAALGRDLNETTRPRKEEEIRVIFHSFPGQELNATVNEAADSWNPPPATARRGADLCLLRLSERITNQATPARLRTFGTLTFRRFRVPGFPIDWKGDLDIALGEIVGTENGLYLLRESVQVSAKAKIGLLSSETRPTGVIAPGFSGAPVEVEETIVGLIAEARGKPSEVTAYMIPVDSFPAEIAQLARSAKNDILDRFAHVAKLPQLLSKKDSRRSVRFDLRLRPCATFVEVLEAHRTSAALGNTTTPSLEDLEGIDLRPPELAKALWSQKDRHGNPFSNLLLHAPGGAGKSSFLFELLLASSDAGLVPFFLDFSNANQSNPGQPSPQTTDPKSQVSAWFRNYEGIGAVDDLFQLAKPSSSTIRPLLVVDGINQVRERAKLYNDLDQLSRQDLAAATIIIADRMTDRGPIAGFTRAVIPPLTPAAYRAALKGGPREAIANDLSWKPILSSPLFLDILLALPDNEPSGSDIPLPSRFSVLNTYFREQCGFEKSDIIDLADFAFNAYKQYGQTAIPKDTLKALRESIFRKLEEKGLVHDLDSSHVEFRHQILHDYLAALKVASTTEEREEDLLRSPAFDVLSLNSASHDAIELAVEALQYPNSLLAKRNPPLEPREFLTEVYDWNFRITLECVASFDRGGKSPLQPWTRHAFYALNLERRFDPFLRTALRAEVLREQIPSLSDLTYLDCTSHLQLEEKLGAAMKETAQLLLPGSLRTEELYCEKWRDLFLRKNPFSERDLEPLWENPLLSWTAANVLRRLKPSDGVARELIRLYRISKATSDSSSRAAGFRWRIVHALGSANASAMKFLVDVTVDRSEDWHVRYGAVRSLMEVAVLRATPQQRDETLGKLRSELSALFQGRTPSLLANVRRELRRACAFNEPYLPELVSPRLDEWISQGLLRYLDLLKEGQRLASENGMTEESAAWAVWVDTVPSIASGKTKSWEERRKTWTTIFETDP